VSGANIHAISAGRDFPMAESKLIKPPPNAFTCEARGQLRAWLAKNHTQTEGMWLVTYKKAAAAAIGRAHLPYDDIVEEVICFGWIDSKVNKLDEHRSMLWLAPRKRGTGWSAPNKARVAKMQAAGRMAPAGAAKVAEAMADGSWSKLDDIEALVTPPDLALALAKWPNATGYFDAFPRSVKRGILEWISTAKLADTRRKRILETARLANENVRANQWRPRN
jgi:uncharacterized protein YdeI (YjbR/CyaY-like superfamily)